MGTTSPQLRPIDQQVVVVMGASSGIGRATALMAARRGALVMGAGRDDAALASLVEQGEGRIAGATCDVADHVAVQRVADAAVDRFGRIDTWAHVAGVSAFGRVEAITPDEWRRVIDVDLLGPVWGARAALPHLRERGGAYVVVSSELARRAFPLQAPYCAAKHGVDGFVEALRVELQEEGAGVSVTQILPAAVGTPFFEHARSRMGVRGSGPPPVYAPERIAEAILDAAQHPRRDIVPGFAPKVQLLAQRVSPRMVDAVARVASFRLQRSSEPREPGDDALFDAPDGDDRVSGVVSSLHR